MGIKEENDVVQEEVDIPPTYLKTLDVNESDGASTPISGDISSTAAGFDQVSTKKLLRKLDWHIVPFLSLLYL